MTVSWIVQSNLGESLDKQRLADAIRESGHDFLEVTVIPFSDDLPDVPSSRPSIFYGSTRFISAVHASARWIPGVYFDAHAFRFATLLDRYGEHMLNAGAELTTLGELASRPWPPERTVFLRPDADLKEFPGQVITLAEVRDWMTRLNSSSLLLQADTAVVVSKPVEILAEYRLVIVDATVASGSLYRLAGRSVREGGVPTEVRRFGQHLAGLYSPAPVFVLDVAVAGQGLRALETNCFHCAGFYASDLPSIARAVSDRAEKSWQQFGSGA